jgi:hypothetical protein
VELFAIDSDGSSCISEIGVLDEWWRRRRRRDASELEERLWDLLRSNICQ